MDQIEITRLLNLYPLPVIGMVGFSGSGKTTLLEKVIVLLKQHQLRIAVIKASHHDIDFDTPGKDSYRLRKAGADTTLLCAKQRWLMIHDQHDPGINPPLADMIDVVRQTSPDLVLIEGFKQETFAKIAVNRSAHTELDNFTLSDDIIAIACDQQFASGDTQHLIEGRQLLNINRPEETAQFILNLIREERP